MKFKPYALIGLWALIILAFAACSLTSSATAVPSTTPAITAQDGGLALPVVNTQPQDTPNIADTGDIEPVASLDDLNRNYAAFGSITIAGMSGSDYDAAMASQWTDIHTPGEPIAYDIDLSKPMDYETIEQYILNLGKYDGVQVSVIGQSELNRNIYMVKLDLAGDTAAEKPLIMLSGSVHAREFAGADYMLKFLNDTLIQAQTDTYTRTLLERATIVSVPLVNPDGRELIIAGGDSSRKSNAHGVDLNRAMPSINAGQLGEGIKFVEDFSTVPGMDFFAGYRLGTESETQAMIKWMGVYVPEAAAYIDLHQQGGISFFDKSFTSSESDTVCLEFAESVNELLEGGYKPKQESGDYSMDGDGGTMTDYARSISEGFVYSYRLGRMALLADSTEMPLICFGDVDNCIEYYEPLNPNFKCMTIEIGRKRSYLGAGENAREKRASEYERYGWDNFLTGTIEILLDDRIN